MRYVIALAAIPVVIWAATPSASPPVVAKVVEPESIREQRQDANTFRLRWSAVADMPPTIEVFAREHGWQDREAQGTASAGRGDDPIPASATHRTRRASLRTDICTRHKMRKVYYGKRWRCRR